MSTDGEKGRKTTTTALINLPLADVPAAFVTKVIELLYYCRGKKKKNGFLLLLK